MNNTPILSVGSLAFDSIQVPGDSVEAALGGSANYFSLSASFFSPVQVVGVVGEDFPQEHLRYLESRNIDTQGIQVKEGKTFHWKGEYKDDYNSAITHDTELNVFGDFNPEVPAHYAKAKYVFLGNITPSLQSRVLEQVENPRLIALDSMNLWINTANDDLQGILKKVNLLIINDGETCLLGKSKNVFTAAEKIMEMGPKCLVVKRGEYGAFLLMNGEYFVAPAVPLKQIKDPTGAGDTFAGGLLGYLASQDCDLSDTTVLKQALLYGTVMASFVVQDFSFLRLKTISSKDIQAVYKKISSMITL